MTNCEAYKPGISPCGHRVLVWPVPKERVTEGGIVIPDVAASREDMAQIEALVLAIGPTAWHDQPGQRPWCRVGDRVLIAKYSGLFREGSDGRHYRVISDLDVVAVIHGEKDHG